MPEKAPVGERGAGRQIFPGRLLVLLKQARQWSHTVRFIEPTTCCIDQLRPPGAICCRPLRRRQR